MSKLDERMMYSVIVRTGPMSYDSYKAFSHDLIEGCLVINQGSLKNGAREEIALPVRTFLSYHTEDLD